MGTRHLILVWYKGKWHIAQYGQWDGYPEGQGINIVKFLNDTDNDAAPDEAHRDPATAGDVNDNEHSPAENPTPETQAAPKYNVAALKAALDKDMLYTPTKEQISEFNQDAAYVAEEAKKVLNSKEHRDRMHSMTREERREFEKKHQLETAGLSPLMLVQPSLSRDCGAQILSLVAHAKEKVAIRLMPEFIMDTIYCEWAYVIDLDAEVFEVYSGCSCKVQGKGRFDDEDFAKDRHDKPFLVVKYAFAELTGMTEHKLVADVNAVMGKENSDGELD